MRTKKRRLNRQYITPRIKLQGVIAEIRDCYKVPKKVLIEILQAEIERLK